MSVFERLTVGYHLPYQVKAMFAQPWVANICAIHALEAVHVEVLDRGPYPRLEELHLMLGNSQKRIGDVQKHIADNEIFPNLKRLGLGGSAEQIDHYRKGPLPNVAIVTPSGGGADR